MAYESSDYGFVPFGEFKPDLRYLANDGLIKAENVVPVYGDYISAPDFTTIAAIPNIGANPATTWTYGSFAARNNGNGYVARPHVTNPNPVAILQVTDAGVVSDVSETSDNSYPSTVRYMHGTTFGSSVIATLYNDSNTAYSVQVQATSGARFTTMIASTFAPRARFVFPLRNNLFLARAYVGTPYDGLSAAVHDTLVAWSKTDDITNFGSFNADPQHIGAGYQSLNYDLGGILGACAGSDYGMIGLENGIVRIDGPPYTFRVVTRDYGCSGISNGGTPYFGDAMCSAGYDIYYASSAGLVRLPGGEGPPELVGDGVFSRWWTDSDFNADSLVGAAIHLAYDPVGNLLFISSTANGGIVVVYNTSERRASYWPNVNIRFQSLGKTRSDLNWLPGRDMRFIAPGGYAKFSAGASEGGDVVLQKGYIQFKPGLTTRIKRIRPVYNVTDQAAIEQISVTLEHTNKPYATPTTSGPFTTIDAGGWITCPTSKASEFHSIKFTMTANSSMYKVVEYTGFEYEVETRGNYPA